MTAFDVRAALVGLESAFANLQSAARLHFDRNEPTIVAPVVHLRPTPQELAVQRLRDDALTALNLPRQRCVPLATDVLAAVYFWSQHGRRQRSEWLKVAVELLSGPPSFKGVAAVLEPSELNEDEIVELCTLMLLVLRLRSVLHDGFLKVANLRSLATALRDYLGEQALRNELAAEDEDDDEEDEGTVHPTPAQMEVRDIPSTPGITRVIACAGSGKTTAAMGLAERVANEGRETLMATAFTRILVADAEKKMKRLDKAYSQRTRSLQARTLNSLSWFAVVKPDPRADAKSRLSLQLRSSDVVKLLRLTDMEGPIAQPKENGRKRGIVRALQVGNRVLKTYKRFVSSDADGIEARHVVRQRPTSPALDEQFLFEMTRRLWARVTDMSDEAAGLPFDAQLKLMQLRREPLLMKFPTTAPDYCLFDEAQDGNDCDISFLASQVAHTRLVFIGDPHQQLYSFRGANGAWTKLDGETQAIYLSDAWRYGPEVAAVANQILPTKNELRKIRGRGPIAQIHRPLFPDATVPYGAYIVHRTNAAVLKSLFRIGMRESGRMIYLRTARDGLKTGDQQLDIFIDASRLRRGVQRAATPPWQLKKFRTWEALVQEVDDLEEDVSPPMLRDIVEMEEPLSKDTFEAEIARIRDCVVDNEAAASLVLTTTHQIKGDEQAMVMLADDFIDIFARRSETWKLQHVVADEVNCLYVAATRAQHHLFLNAPVMKLMMLEQGLHKFYLKTEPQGKACEQCRRVVKRRIHYDPGFPAYIERPADSGPPSTPPPRRRLEQSSSGIFSGSNWGTPKKGSHVDHIDIADQMPCCFECAKGATYTPLVDYASFWEMLLCGSEQVDAIDWPAYFEAAKRPLPAHASIANDLAGFTKSGKERVLDINGAIEAEFRTTGFWTSLAASQGTEVEAGGTETNDSEASTMPHNDRKRARSVTPSPSGPSAKKRIV